MKVRTIKKLIKQYPPIIEIRLPERLNTQDVLEQLKWMKENKIPKYLKGSLIIVFPIDEPSGLFELKTGLSEAKLQEFKNLWEDACKNQGTILLSNESKLDIIEIKEPNFVTIHSAIKDTPFMYQKTKERLNKLIQEARDEKQRN